MVGIRGCAPLRYFYQQLLGLSCLLVPSYPRVALWAGLEPAKTWVKAMCLYQFDYHRMSENLTLYCIYKYVFTLHIYKSELFNH